MRDLFSKAAEAIYMIEGDNVHIGVVYDLFLDLKEHVQSVPEHTLIEKEKLCELFDNRWTKLDFDCMGWAYLLDPHKYVQDRMETNDHLRSVHSLKST